MLVLAVNCGSSSLKFDLVDLASSPPPPGQRLDRLMSGEVALDAEAADHAEAASVVFARLAEAGLVDAVDVVVHRIVHGGPHLAGPVVLDAAVLRQIEQASRLAPLHNGPALAALGRLGPAFGDGTPSVAVFDTGFHHHLPPGARHYALPGSLTERHRIRRYGFHGTAHSWLVQRWAHLSGRPLPDTRLVTLQLGSGCSAAAVAGGASVDTSMGFTPNEGLVMATRSGDLDPGLVTWLMGAEGLSPAQVDELLNHRSGLLGLSGTSPNVGRLLAAEARGDGRAALALDVYCRRILKAVGGFLAVLGGADAIVFGGGVGEHSPEVRLRSCRGLEFAGVEVDHEANRAAVGGDHRISTPASAVEVWALATDEASVMAAEAAACLEGT